MKQYNTSSWELLTEFNELMYYFCLNIYFIISYFLILVHHFLIFEIILVSILINQITDTILIYVHVYKLLVCLSRNIHTFCTFYLICLHDRSCYVTCTFYGGIKFTRVTTILVSLAHEKVKCYGEICVSFQIILSVLTGDSRLYYASK